MSGWGRAQIQVSWLPHWGYFYHIPHHRPFILIHTGLLLFWVLGKKKSNPIILRILWLYISHTYQASNSIHCSQDYIWKLTGDCHKKTVPTELKICLKTELDSGPMTIYVLLDFLISTYFRESWFPKWQDGAHPSCAYVMWIAV